MTPQPSASREKPSQGRGLALALIVLALPLLLGGWKITMNKGINTSYVDRIEDGKTKRSEILTLFGDPQEIKRTPGGMIYVYQTVRSKETVKKKSKDDKEPVGLSSVDSPHELDQRLKTYHKKKEVPAEELESILTIYFKPDGETVRNHSFKQY